MEARAITSRAGRAAACERELMCLPLFLFYSLSLQKFGHGDIEQGGDGDDSSRARVERVHLGPQSGCEEMVLDPLQARAVHVPDAPLPDISEALPRRCEVPVREEERWRNGDACQRRRVYR